MLHNVSRSHPVPVDTGWHGCKRKPGADSGSRSFMRKPRVPFGAMLHRTELVQAKRGGRPWRRQDRLGRLGRTMRRTRGAPLRGALLRMVACRRHDTFSELTPSPVPATTAEPAPRRRECVRRSRALPGDCDRYHGAPHPPTRVIQPTVVCASSPASTPRAAKLAAMACEARRGASTHRGIRVEV